MGYIGATIEEVRTAVAHSRVEFKKYQGLTDVRGIGAVRLSRSVAGRLADQWYRSPVGTKIVVAYVHPPAHQRMLGLYPYFHSRHIRFAIMSRPKLTPEYKQKLARMQRPNLTGAEKMFASEMERSLLNRVRGLARIGGVSNNDGGASYTGGFWTPAMGNTITRLFDSSHIFVWPAGILDARQNAAVDKIHRAIDSNATRKRHRDWWNDTATKRRAGNLIKRGVIRKRTRVRVKKAGVALKHTRLKQRFVPEIHANILKKAFPDLTK